jgi:hypothetical protein
MKPRLAVLLPLLAACNTTIGIQGGPDRRSVEIPATNFPEGMQPLIAGSPRALAEYQRVEGRNSLGNTFLWAGFGALAPCIALPAVDQANNAQITGLTWAGIGFCGAAILLDVAAIVFLPGPSSWGDVLRAHNEERPDAPYYSEDLGVEPPR